VRPAGEGIVNRQARWPRTRTWIGTKALIGISVLVFVADYLTGQRILLWGAVSHGVWAGEWQRLLAPHFIHSGLSHIAFNMYALYVFGRLVEGMIGTARFLIVYFVGGIIGFYASLLMRPEGLAVGASAAIFSLMGFALHYRLRRLPKRWLGIDSSFAQILGLNLVIGFTVPNVDQFAHLGGLIGGAIAGSLVGLPRPLHAAADPPVSVENGEASEEGGGFEDPEAARPPRFSVPRVGVAERAVAVLLVAGLSWAALSPISFAKATRLTALEKHAEARYGRYFAPFVATDVALLWLGDGAGEGEWRPVRGRLERRGNSPIALGVYWRWVRGGSRADAGEYAVYWRRLDASGAWQLWHVDEGWVVEADPQGGLIYRRSLIVEQRAGELDGRWRVSVEVGGKSHFEQEFEIASTGRL